MFTHTLDVAPDTPIDDLLGAEWLLTNGTGGYAMGTAVGCNARRYHGLLVAATDPPVGRIIAVSQMHDHHHHSAEPALGDVRQTLDFTTLEFRGGGGGGERIFSPRGHALLTRFDRGLSVRWQYQWGAIGFTRELLLHWKQQAITLRYRIHGLELADCFATLRLRPMVTLRDFHGLLHRDRAPAFEPVDHRGEFFTVADPTHPQHAVTLTSSHGSFAVEPDWWYRVTYPVDAERGQGDQEDYYVPALLEAPVAEEVDIAITAALGYQPVEPVLDALDRAGHLRKLQVPGCKFQVSESEQLETRNLKLETCLAIAADDFLADRTLGGQSLSTVLAGFPWFADWGRDTFISLPGLLLCTGRFAEARAVLRVFADAIADGLVPNRFDDYDPSAAHYNTVDASLWFIRAAALYVRAADDRAAWNDWLGAACGRIIDAYAAGTRYDIHLDDDGLIAAGSADTQLTWMDAAIGEGEQRTVFTPRHGKAVEINALWHHALCEMIELERESERAPHNRSEPGRAGPVRDSDRGDTPRLATLAQLAKRCRKSFTKTFWNPNRHCLYDHVRTEADGSIHRDASIRPNQIFAVALPHSPLPRAKQKKVLETVRAKLLTPLDAPVGLRTLPTDDPAYHGRYTGDQYHRDQAYHQGTIWPWLIGPYAEAVLRVGRFSKRARADARETITPLLETLVEGGAASSALGQLPEIYEADTHRPVGCAAQAWSVAEIIRVLALIESRE